MRLHLRLLPQFGSSSLNSLALPKKKLATAFPIHITKMNTAKELIKELPLSLNDVARLALEIAEGLGAAAEGMTRAEMMKVMRRVAAEGVKAVRAAAQTVSFEEAARASLEARQDRRPTTRRDLRHFIGRMLRVKGVATRPLRAMSVTECKNLLEKAFPASPSSYKKGRVILNSIFSYGIRHEWCDRNPVQAIETPIIREKPIEPLSLEEVERLERTAERPEHREMQLSLKLMLYCGVRPTEVTRINLQRDIMGNELIIRPQTSKTGGGRIVPLRKVAPYIRLHKGTIGIPDQWEQRWRALRRAARFRKWQADVCRHTFATYHARYFRNLPELQMEMGHRDTSLLRTRYISAAYISRKDARAFWRR